MTFNDVMAELESYGNDQTKKIYLNHGAKEPVFGVKGGDLKKILKKTKKNHELSLKLYDTGNSDAMYLAGLMADEKQISKATLNDWVQKAYWYYLSEYTVPWIAAETPYGFELGLEWIKSDVEPVAAAGWSVFSSFARVNPDEDLDIDTYSALLDQVDKEIHAAPNRVRYAMNNFVIATGTFIKSLTAKSKKVAKSIGKVEVNMGGTACKVPLATTYIEKVEKAGKIGNKRKNARC